EPAPAQRAANPPPAARTVERNAPAPSRSQPAPANRAAQRSNQPPPAATAVTERTQPIERTVEPLRQTPPASSVTVALPQLDNNLARGSAATTVPASSPALAPDSDPGALDPEHKVSILPWLLAALALAAGL